MVTNMIWSDFLIVLVQAAVFRRKAGEVQGRGQIRAPGEPVSNTPFGRLVGDIDSSGEPQVSSHPIGHLERQLSHNLLHNGLQLHRHGLTCGRHQDIHVCACA